MKSQIKSRINSWKKFELLVDFRTYFIIRIVQNKIEYIYIYVYSDMVLKKKKKNVEKVLKQTKPGMYIYIYF